MKTYDCVIIGGGVGGMSAAIYAKRRNKNVVIIEKFSLGGEVLQLQRIHNFPSQSEIDGVNLAQLFSKQIDALGVEVIYDEITSTKLGELDKILVGKKDTYVAKSVIIACGMNYIEAGVNENDFLGKGVSYCAVCDANFFKNKPVCVISKDGSGLKAAKVLAEVCSEVTILDEGDLELISKANTNKKIKILSNSKIVKVDGNEKVSGVEYSQNGKIKTLECDGVFISLGRKAKTDIYDLKKDEQGFIITDENMRTSRYGVFAVGDIRKKGLRQIVTACSDGAIAGQLC